MFKPTAVGGGRGLGALLQHCLRRGHTGRQVPVIYRLNMVFYLQSLFGLLFTTVLIG
jgi:hypothetical protein